MSAIVILYASVDGQAARVAERMATVLRRAGHSAAALDAQSHAARPLIEECDAVIVGGSIRYGRHSRRLQAMVRDNREAIDARPNAFYSVCLSAGGPGAKPITAWGYIDDFITRTGWQPRRIASFAGALPYRRYNPFIRFMMRLIVGAAGGETDTSRDYEYTNWVAVERFATDFAAQLQTARAA